MTKPYNNNTDCTIRISIHSVIGVTDTLLQVDLEYPTWLIKSVHPPSFQDPLPVLHFLIHFLPFKELGPSRKPPSCIDFGWIHSRSVFYT